MAELYLQLPQSLTANEMQAYKYRMLRKETAQAL